MSGQGSRDLALDFVKGLLVVGMVAYHVGSFFIRDQQLQLFLQGYALAFISGSWVFISGVIVSSSYYNRFAADKIGVTKRLWIRGIKLLAIFSILNGLIAILGLSPNYSGEFGFSDILNVFLIGDPARTSFEILVGIGYVLLIAPIFLWLDSAGILIALGILAAGTVTNIAIAKLPTNAWMILCGIGGILIGRLVLLPFIRSIPLSQQRRNGALIVSMVGVTLYMVMTIKYGYGKRDIHVYLLGIVSILSAFYLAYHWFSRDTFVDRMLNLMARYSLVCYIWQMAIIWAMYYMLVSTSLWSPYVVSFVVTLVVMTASIVILDQVLARSELTRRIYRFVFG